MQVAAVTARRGELGDKMLDHAQTANDNLRVVLLSWFGSFLCNNPIDDWFGLVMRPWAPGTPELLYLQQPSGEGGIPEDQASWISKVGRFVPRPRYLPTLKLFRQYESVYGLQDVEPGSASLGKFVVALPEGKIEINRLHVSDWEMFRLLTEDQYRRLSWLVTSAEAEPEEGGDAMPLLVTFGFKLAIGSLHVDLNEALQAGRFDEPVTLQAVSGEVLHIVARRAPIADSQASS